MPIQSSSPKRSRWAPAPPSPKSVYGNFQRSALENAEQPVEIPPPAAAQPAETEGARPLARLFIYSYLARAFEDPSPSTWNWLGTPETLGMLRRAAEELPGAPEVGRGVAILIREFSRGSLEEFSTEYISAFGHAARGRCPLNEIEYGDPQADPLFQPHRLADLAAFYRAHGLELAGDAAERQDHLCIELEFMAVLAAREAYAGADVSVDREMIRLPQRKFLREHLGRWSAAFAGRLADEAGDGLLGALAGLLSAFVRAECEAFEVPIGDDILPLRPADDAAENLCSSCGMQSALPGAIPAGGANAS